MSRKQSCDLVRIVSAGKSVNPFRANYGVFHNSFKGNALTFQIYADTVFVFTLITVNPRKEGHLLP